MNLASFKQRYPSFINDSLIQIALGDAELLITPYNILESQRELAIGYLAAHILTLQPTLGASEQTVLKVKSGTNEVQFSDKDNKDWFSLSSYGVMFALMIQPAIIIKKYGVVNNNDKHAIKFDGILNEQGDIERPDYD